MTWRVPTALANMFEGYHSFHNEDGEAHGSYQVFFEDGSIGERGWYWASGFPGCLFDGDPVGPFVTSREARDDADPYAPAYEKEEAA